MLLSGVVVCLSIGIHCLSKMLTDFIFSSLFRPFPSTFLFKRTSKAFRAWNWHRRWVASGKYRSNAAISEKSLSGIFCEVDGIILYHNRPLLLIDFLNIILIIFYFFTSEMIRKNSPMESLVSVFVKYWAIGWLFPVINVVFPIARGRQILR